MTGTENFKDISKKLIVIDQAEGNVKVPDKETLRELIYNIEMQDHKYFVIEI